MNQEYIKIVLTALLQDLIKLIPNDAPYKSTGFIHVADMGSKNETRVLYCVKKPRADNGIADTSIVIDATCRKIISNYLVILSNLYDRKARFIPRDRVISRNTNEKISKRLEALEFNNTDLGPKTTYTKWTINLSELIKSPVLQNYINEPEGLADII